MTKCGAYLLKRIDQFEQDREIPAARKSRLWKDKHLCHGKRSGTTSGGKVQRP